MSGLDHFVTFLKQKSYSIYIRSTLTMEMDLKQLYTGLHDINRALKKNI